MHYNSKCPFMVLESIRLCCLFPKSSLMALHTARRLMKSLTLNISTLFTIKALKMLTLQYFLLFCRNKPRCFPVSTQVLYLPPSPKSNFLYSEHQHLSKYRFPQITTCLLNCECWFQPYEEQGFHFEFSIADGYPNHTRSRSHVKIPYSFIDLLIKQRLRLCIS